MAYQMDANAIMDAQVKAEKEIIRLRDALENIKRSLYAKKPIVEMYRLAEEALMQSPDVSEAEK